MKRFWVIVLSIVICLQITGEAKAQEENQTDEFHIDSPSGILMEASSGKIIYEKDADTKRAPASVTKIMTMLLIFDSLSENKILLNDKVRVSEYAASMGGSQVFLEPGEEQTVETMLKCISVASANDACVAMAEHLEGTEEAFVKKMNERAQNLGMKNTTFKNCNGLDANGHETTARDIALMSKELITKYPQVQNYCMIWMENITHTTKKGTSDFGLTNTNKLVRHYPHATGLKTGSTSQAKFCVSATAKKDDVELIAVIMAADDSKTRFADATRLLNTGFAKCTKYVDDEKIHLSPLHVQGGVKDQVKIEPEHSFTYIDITGANLTQMKRTIEIDKEAYAPVQKGEQVGRIIYTLDGKEVGDVAIITKETVNKMKMRHAFRKTIQSFLL